MDSQERPEAAHLYDAALLHARRMYGGSARVKSLHLVTRGRGGKKLEVVIDVPEDWEIEDEEGLPRIRSPDCFAEVLATIVEASRRLTRESLMEQMEKKDRKRAESAVCKSLEDLLKLGILNNRQDGPQKGYGLPDW